MRDLQNTQLQLGKVDISKIKFDERSRDDIPKILKGLQHIYINSTIRDAVFKILEKNILSGVDKNNGRPGMELWKIFVLGVLRLDLNCDYDRIRELANHHNIIRAMLGHPKEDEFSYQIQTLKDNVKLLTPELLEEINQVVVQAGHILLKKKENEALHGRCDSFVVETNVHYPTDINLLFDAMRKIIRLTARLSEAYQQSEWRQSDYNIRHLKRLMRIAQNKKRIQGKTEEQKEKRDKMIAKAHQEYLVVVKKYLEKACGTLQLLEEQGLKKITDAALIGDIKHFVSHANRQIDQIHRRVLQGETIPHQEKVFSIFEPHTEWICKGKAGVPVELGLRVCILEDQHQFILHHRVMENETDDQVAIPMVEETQVRFSDLASTSFDKGFHSPVNQNVLSMKLDLLALPRKGKLSKTAAIIEGSEAFRKARRKHSAVESAINSLEVHGLDYCPDRGLYRFKCYVALAIASHNIHRIGAILQKREEQRLQRQNKKRLKNRLTLKLVA
jgi:IS5 family transposase